MSGITNLFYQGEYSQILAARAKSDLDHAFTIGSLCFLGRAEEAENYFKNKTLGENEKSYCHFFLSLAWSRQSKFLKTKKYLRSNRLLAKKNKTPEIQFLNEQGLSFYLFYLGQFKKSLNWSKKAISSASQLQNEWMKSLSYDLYANNLIQNGQIHQGLRYFELAIGCAQKNKNFAVVSAIETSYIITCAEYGINLNQTYQQMKKMMALNVHQDGFSNSNLALEMARQQTLRGEWLDAAEILNRASTHIFRGQNRRQEARLYLRWAEISFQKNDVSMCFHYIRAGLKCLNQVDQTYELQFLGLESKIYEHLLKQKVPSEISDKIRTLSKTYDSVKNKNILERSQGLALLKQNDDNIHDFLIQAAQDELSAKTIILKTQYFSWLYRFFGFIRGKKYIVLNLEKQSITLLSDSGVAHFPKELSSLNLKILGCLSKGYVTKEKLLQDVWGYNYDSLRHDSLIYSALSSLRKTISVHHQLIETSELGYLLTAEVVDLASAKEAEGTQELARILDLEQLNRFEINPRQLQILQFLEKNDLIDVRSARVIFAVSEITAHRDLKSLLNKELVVRIGRGRSTQYALKSRVT